MSGAVTKVDSTH